MKLTQASALVLVDFQRDFLAGGARAVPRGEDVVMRTNALLEGFSSAGLTLVATRDWHPAKHASFQSEGGEWPRHCVQGSDGAEFAVELVLPSSAWVISKGTAADSDAHSAFDGTDLAERLREAGIEALYVCGLGTEFGIRETVLEALEEDFEVVLVADACRSFSSQAARSAGAVEDMMRAGARIASSGAVANALAAFTG